MRKFTRLEEPEILRNNWEKWGNEYAKHKQESPKHRFKWHENSYSQIRLLLFQQTNEHCSYCDNADLKKGDFTIDHFKPKAIFHDIAYKWDNLFFCCGHCQKAKGVYYSDNLLRPDTSYFEFSRYFSYNYVSHEIQVKISASEEDREKAKETIRIFDLNNNGLTKTRRASFRIFELDKITSNPVIEDYNFRFLFE